MTDFLDRLEADLRDAAERRLEPHRRRPDRALKLVAAVAVAVAIAVVGIELLTRVDGERAAAPQPTPAPVQATPEATPTPLPSARTVAATSGEPGLLNVLAAPTAAFVRVANVPGSLTADRTLGPVVLYRPASKQAAEIVSQMSAIDRLEPMTAADEEGIHGDVSDADVVIVFGIEQQQRVLNDPSICAPAGGDLKLCLARSDEARYSTFVAAGRPLAIAPVPGEWWSWAALSPDGQTILAEMSGDCRQAWRVSRNGSGKEALDDGPSTPLGWTTDGRMIISVPESAEGCRLTEAPGIYLVTPAGEATKVAPPGTDVPRSIESRGADEVTG